VSQVGDSDIKMAGPATNRPGRGFHMALGGEPSVESSLRFAGTIAAVGAVVAAALVAAAIRAPFAAAFVTAAARGGGGGGTGGSKRQCARGEGG